MNERILLSSPDVTHLEEEALIRAIRTGWVAPLGPEVDAFEEELAAHSGRKYAVALSSGTAALQLALITFGVLLPQYLSLYTKQQARRHEVRPGITGLAQVSGRNLLTWEERFALDGQYVDQRSLALDASILWRTVHVVLRRVGVTAEGHATAEPFAGTR